MKLPPEDLKDNLGLAQQCWHMAQSVCAALGRKFEDTSPQEIYEHVSALQLDIFQWLQIAECQREWFRDNHEDGVGASVCPTFMGIDRSKRLLGRK
jgi:hypothetical protein